MFELHSISIQFLLSAVALFIAGSIALLIRQAIRKLKIHPDQKRRAYKVTTYGSTIGLILMLIVIWADQLRDAALVLSAFAVAIVISTKELIMCVTGWWLKLAGGHFRVGDRIQVGVLHGDVVDYGLLTISLLELDREAPSHQRTGSILTVPNSLLLTEAVVNHTMAFSFRWHSVVIKPKREKEWSKAEEALRKAGDAVWKTYKEEASKEILAFTERFANTPQGGEPRVYVGHDKSGNIRLELRVGLPVREEHEVEDRILRAYYEEMRSLTVGTTSRPAVP